METCTCGTFKITYTLFTDAAPGNDIQFGMDFTIEERNGSPLCQLIFPATAVGNNQPMQWNIDNHATGNKPAALIYRGASEGRIVDTPREISHVDNGDLSTKFAIYIVNIEKAEVYSSGVKFGYTINTGASTPETIFTGFERSTLSNEQKAVILKRCDFIKFV